MNNVNANPSRENLYAEKVFGEQRPLWQCLSTDVLRQCRLRLMLEAGLAGGGEERHLWYSAWARY